MWLLFVWPVGDAGPYEVSSFRGGRTQCAPTRLRYLFCQIVAVEFAIWLLFCDKITANLCRGARRAYNLVFIQNNSGAPLKNARRFTMTLCKQRRVFAQIINYPSFCLGVRSKAKLAFVGARCARPSKHPPTATPTATHKRLSFRGSFRRGSSAAGGEGVPLSKAKLLFL